MRFKSRLYNSLAQGLSGKNEQPVGAPQRRETHYSCIGVRPLWL